MDMKTREKLMSWERGFSQPCLIPNILLYKFESESNGCFAVKFSNKGRYLAAACSESEVKCLIKIFNVEKGTLAAIIGLHQGIIHELKWAPGDNFLLSASNDSLAKLWNTSDIESAVTLSEDYGENEKKVLLGKIQHPSYVYAVEFLPEYANKLRPKPVIATACFDGKVRIWVAEIDEKTGREMHTFLATELSVDQIERDVPGTEENVHCLIGHNYPTSMVFDDTGRLYIGDSVGEVHVWDVIVSQVEQIFRQEKKKLPLQKLKQSKIRKLKGKQLIR